MRLSLIANCAAALTLTACAQAPETEAPLLLASNETRIMITSDPRDAQLAADCSAQIGQLVQRFRSQIDAGDSYAALYVGYDREAGTCSDFAIARRTHSTADAINLARAVCRQRNDGQGCHQIALAVPSNYREGLDTISPRASQELREAFPDLSGFSALAISATGAYGVATGQTSPEAARTAAVSSCDNRVAEGFGRGEARYVNPALVVDATCTVIIERTPEGTNSRPVTE